MAETLLAILLCTSSAKDSNLVYRWPQSPQAQQRLSRPRPDCATSPAHFDNVWKASNYGEAGDQFAASLPHVPLNDPEYEWKKSTPHDDLRRSPSRANSANPHHRSPSRDHHCRDEYENLFGYSTSFLARLLCPQRSMCHQRCELLVDDLVFIGHPVCVEPDGEWRFRPEKHKSNARGREARNAMGSSETLAEESPDHLSVQDVSSKASWLTTFNLVLVLDPPDPSSSASGSFLKYLDVVYKHIAFSFMAVLFQQQVLSNFVENECDVLGSLKDSYVSKDHILSEFQAQALQVSSIASAMKLLYEAIKTSSIAYITVDNIPLELQLPPFLDQLLHAEDEELVYQPLNEDDAALYKQAWGEDLSEDGWNLPSLEPWKSLLMLDSSVRTPYVDHEDSSDLLEGLVKFMDIASVTLSLGDMASLLDWDYETKVVPTVRWLVEHRRAKVVDIVHNGLKTVFTLPSKFSAPLRELVEDFDKDFAGQPEVFSLPEILSAISTSSSQNHFFATVVKTKDCLPQYHEVVIWMLKREMLVTLHLRVRVVATKELKLRVKHRMEEKAWAKKHVVGRGRSKLFQEVDSVSPPAAFVSLSPKAAREYARKDILSPHEYEPDDEEEEDTGPDDSGWDTNDDDTKSSLIPDPGRATVHQNQWLVAMSEGKDAHIVNLFNKIHQYFDGKHTDDEILFKAEIPRKQLRQILHHYDEYLQTFMHP